MFFFFHFDILILFDLLNWQFPQLIETGNCYHSYQLPHLNKILYIIDSDHKFGIIQQ